MDKLTLWSIVIMCLGIALAYYVVLKNTSKKELELAKTKDILHLNFSDGTPWSVFRKNWKKFFIVWLAVLILATWWAIKSN